MSYSPGVTRNKSAEVFQENVRLKNTVQELKKLDGADSIISEQMDNDDLYHPSKRSSACDRFDRYVLSRGLIWILFALLLTVVAVYFLTRNNTAGVRIHFNSIIVLNYNDSTNYRSPTLHKQYPRDVTGVLRVVLSNRDLSISDYQVGLRSNNYGSRNKSIYYIIIIKTLSQKIT